MHALFHQGLKESSLREKREKRVYFCKTSDMHSFAHFAVSMVKLASFLPGSLSLSLSFQTLIFTFHILGL